MNIFFRGMACSLVLLIAGCRHPHTPVVETPRAVKLESFGVHRQGQLDLPALVRQAQRADLAFESSGRIESVQVDVGDRVHRGDLLARLDNEPLRLREQQAEANVRAAMAQYSARQTQQRQQQAMLDDGAIAAASLSSTRAATDAALTQLQVAKADLALAQRAMQLSELRAPFDGSVVARLQQPSAEIAAGQTVLQVEGEGRLQVLANLPASIATTVHAGQLLQAATTGTPTASVALRLLSVSDHFDNSAMAQAIFDVQGPAPTLHSGEAVLLRLPSASDSLASLPLSAISPRLDRQNASVFVYEPAQHRVRERTVGLGNIVGERIEIVRGLRAGEQVVSAGVEFLTKGQAAVPLEPRTSLSAEHTP